MSENTSEFASPAEYTYQHLTQVTEDDLTRLGAQVLMQIFTSQALGHRRAIDSQMYIAATHDPMSQLVKDWMVSQGFTSEEEAEGRLHQFVESVGGLDIVADAAADRM